MSASATDAGGAQTSPEKESKIPRKVLKRRLDVAESDLVLERQQSGTLKKKTKELEAENARLLQALHEAGLGPPSKRAKAGETSELVRRSGKQSTACVFLFPPHTVVAAFKSKLGSSQDDDDSDEEHINDPPAVIAARRSARAAGPMPAIFSDPAFVERCAQQMIDAIPASAQKLKKKSWFSKEHAKGRRDQATTTMSKINSHLVQIFGPDVGALLTTLHPAQFASTPQIAALLADDRFLCSDPKPNTALLDRFYRSTALIRTLWLVLNGPSSIQHDGHRDPRAWGTNAELWDQRSITKGLVGFGSTALYCVLRGATPFSPAAKDGLDKLIDLQGFYVAKVQHLEDMETHKPKEYAALMDHLNKTVLPQHHAGSVIPVPALRPADIALHNAIFAPAPPPPDATAKWACMASMQHPDLAEDLDGNLVPATVQAAGDRLYRLRFIETAIVGDLGVLDIYPLLEPADFQGTGVYLPSLSRSDIHVDSRIWDTLAAREPVRRYNVQWALDLMREALRDPLSNIPQDLIPSDLDRIEVLNMNLWDRRADINGGNASRTREDGDSLIWVFLTAPIILPSDQLFSASDAPQPLRELFSTLQHYYRVTVKESSAITDIQYYVHYTDDGQTHLQIANFRTHSPGAASSPLHTGPNNTYWLTDGGVPAYEEACAQHTCTQLCKLLKLGVEQQASGSEA